MVYVMCPDIVLMEPTIRIVKLQLLRQLLRQLIIATITIMEIQTLAQVTAVTFVVIEIALIVDQAIIVKDTLHSERILVHVIHLIVVEYVKIIFLCVQIVIAVVLKQMEQQLLVLLTLVVKIMDVRGTRSQKIIIGVMF